MKKLLTATLIALTMGATTAPAQARGTYHPHTVGNCMAVIGVTKPHVMVGYMTFLATDEMAAIEHYRKMTLYIARLDAESKILNPTIPLMKAKEFGIQGGRDCYEIGVNVDTGGYVR